MRFNIQQGCIHNNWGCVYNFLIFDPHLNGASYHSHTYRYLICKAGRCIIYHLGTPRVYYIESAFCIVLTTLNKQAYARCEMYAHLPGVNPTDVPD